MKCLVNFTEKDLGRILVDLQDKHPNERHFGLDEIRSLVQDIQADMTLWQLVSMRVEEICRNFLKERSEQWNT